MPLSFASSFQPSKPNSVGSLNNVVTVKRSDFEVFEALAIDGLHTSHKNKHSKCLPTIMNAFKMLNCLLS